MFSKTLFEEETKIKELQARLDEVRKIEVAIVQELRKLVYKIERQ